MNRIQKCFAERSGNILNIYLTAGYPALDALPRTVLQLAAAGVDLVEVGMPYSDPLADGPTIQHSSQVALENGMHLELLFRQIREIRAHSEIPIILMGYLNQVIQYGEERFLDQCQASGVDGLILPDLPLDEYEAVFQQPMQQRGLGISFLITPQTSEARIRKIDALSTDFVYMVSRSSITGGQSVFGPEQIRYFERIAGLGLRNHRLIGFGISTAEAFALACRYADGGIVGSAFIRAVGNGSPVEGFVQKIRGLHVVS
ncbi:MAG: tryptophan synthase subunit alpha [Phaeodactylibacter sp.]|nr:tryptophan synthase subunit alpha [Phaeodactylibacter sp.]